MEIQGQSRHGLGPSQGDAGEGRESQTPASLQEVQVHTSLITVSFDGIVNRARSAGICAGTLGIACVAAFVGLPLLGGVPVVRVAPILLFAFVLTLLVARPWTWSSAQWQAVDEWEPSRVAVRWAAIAVGLMVFWFVLTRFRSGDINAIDFTVYYDRPNFQTLLGRPLYIESADDPLRAYRSYFAVHAHWVMLPLAALYFISATPLWVLALSVVAVIVGAVYTLRIVQFTGAGGLVASASAFAFVFNDNTARTLNYGFHAEVLYAWFIPWMIHSGLHRRWMSFGFASLACVAVKEDAFLLIIAVVISIALLVGRTLTRVERLVLLPAPVALAMLNLILYFGYLVPRLSATGAPFYASYWANYGPTALAAGAGMLRNPYQVLTSTLTSPFFTRVILAHLYLPVIGWRWVVGIVPVIVLYSSSGNDQLRSFGIYYAIVLVPFLVLGAAQGAVRLAGVITSDRGRARALAGMVIVFGALLAGISNAGYSLRPWKGEISALPGFLQTLGSGQPLLVQSGLYPHAGYESRIQLLTTETLQDPKYVGATVVLAPGLSGYPLTTIDLQRLAQLPVIAAGSGLVAVRNIKRVREPFLDLSVTAMTRRAPSRGPSRDRSGRAATPADSTRRSRTARGCPTSASQGPDRGWAPRSRTHRRSARSASRCWRADGFRTPRS